MHAQPIQAEWLRYVVPVVIIGLIMVFRMRNMRRERPLKLERLWIVPAIYCAIAALTFWYTPPTSLAAWIAVAIGLVAGAAIGWHRGRLMRITVNPETHEVSQQASPAAMLLILGLILLKTATRNMDGLIPGVHVDVAAATDVAIALALAMLTATRVEMFLRARKLLAEARAA